MNTHTGDFILASFILSLFYNPIPITCFTYASQYDCRFSTHANTDTQVPFIHPLIVSLETAVFLLLSMCCDISPACVKQVLQYFLLVN